jgi:serine protease Do
MRGLPRLVAQTPIGKDVDVEVLRKGQKRILRVAVGRLAEETSRPRRAARTPPRTRAARARARSPRSRAAPPSRAGQALFGLGLAPLSDDLRTKYGLNADAKGVVVTEVDPASPAAEKGIKAGDVIVEIAQEPVTSVDDIIKGIDKVKTAGGKAVLLRLKAARETCASSLCRYDETDHAAGHG